MFTPSGRVSPPGQDYVDQKQSKMEAVLAEGLIHPAYRSISRADSEGLIPIEVPDAKVVYVVDCQNIHLVEPAHLFPDGPAPGADVSDDDMRSRIRTDNCGSSLI